MGKTILKILAGIIVGLAVIVYFSYDYWLEKKLKYQLSEIINKDPNSLYEYSFSKLNIHLMEGSVDLKGIKIRPTETAYDSLANEENGVRFLLNLNMEEIKLKGFEITKFLTTGIISAESLTITEPVFDYFFHPRKKKANSTLPLNSIFSDKFVEANLGVFSIENAQIKIIDQTRSGPAILIHHMDFELTKAHINSTTLQRFSPFDYEDIKIVAAGINIDASENFSIKSDSLRFRVKDETILIKNFQVNPKLGQKRFANKYQVQKQWFAITLDELVLNQIDFDSFVESGLVDIGKIELKSPNIGLYKDKSKPPPPFKRKLLPASAIKTIPWALSIDTVVITNGFVTINETSALTSKDSHLTLNKLNATVYNFTNDSGSKKNNPIMELNAASQVMGVAATQINMKFDLNSKIDEFSVHGSVGSVSGKTFNPVLEPMMAIRVTAGMVNHIEFSFTAMDTLSRGTLDADYKGMKLEVFKADSTAKKHHKQGLLSFAANTVVKSNNNKGRTNYIQGVIKSERVQEKDVWPYLWHSIQSGLVSTLVPVTNKKDAKQQQKQFRKDLRKDKKAK